MPRRENALVAAVFANCAFGSALFGRSRDDFVDGAETSWGPVGPLEVSPQA